MSVYLLLISGESTDFRPLWTGFGFVPFGGIWIKLWCEPGHRDWILSYIIEFGPHYLEGIKARIWT